MKERRLTPKELVILTDLATTGASNEELAKRYNLKASTVRTHIQNILMHLGLHSRTEAVVYFWVNLYSQSGERRKGRMSQEPGEMEHGLGAIPDRYDPRDYQFRTTLAPGLAKEAAAIDRKFYTMVSPDFRLNQGGEGTCVGHAATNVLLAGPSPHPAYEPFQTEEQAHQFARKLYLDASGDSTYQQGMYPRDACAELLRDGLIESYWKVLQVEDLVTALLTFGPVMVAVPWYSSMDYKDSRLSDLYGNYWVKVNLESTLRGYHDIAFTGIDMAPDNGAPAFFRFENSWGENWGQNGTARVSVESFRRINLWDNWTFKEKSF